jgi:predicted RNA-binding protein with PUA-like domain
MTINSKPYPDHTAFDKKAKYYDVKSKKESPTWLMVDVKYKRKLKKIITLSELKSHKKLKDMRVVQKGNRLSITEVQKKDWEYILKLEEK